MNIATQVSALPMRKIIQFTKADEKTHTVSGLVTAETPDKEGETCNYKAAKKAYQDWSNEFAKATKKSGAEPSLGNIRVQHTDQVGGKAIDIVYDDDAKEILITSEPIDEEMWQAIAKGFYTGYSQAGDYAWRKCGTCGNSVAKADGNYCSTCKQLVPIEYGPVIAEVSYVDNPCHGDAHFDLVKADGTHQMVKFQQRGVKKMDEPQEQELSPALMNKINAMIAEGVAKASAKTKRVAGEDLTADCFAYVGDKDDTSTWKLPIKFSTDEKSASHVRNALARFDQTKGIPEADKDKVKAKLDAAAEKHDIEVSGEVKKTVKTLIKTFIDGALAKRLPTGLKKDMYTVARFAGMINDLAYILFATQYEADFEQDNSTLPDELQEDLENLVETFLAMAEEESTELTTATAERIGKAMKIDENGLQKAYSKAAGIIGKMKKAHDDHHEALTSMSEDHCEKMKGHLDDLKECMGGATKVTKASTHQQTSAKIDEQEEGEIVPIDPEELGTKNIAEKTFTASEVEKIVDRTVQKVIKALTKEEDEEKTTKSKKTEEEDDEEEKPEKTRKSTGLGNRSTVRSGNGPVISGTPVTKAEDSPVTMVPKRTAMSTETVRKALQEGDHDAAIELMKSATPHNGVPVTLVGAVSALGRSRR